MCGIIGIASNKPVSINIINSLKKLEYRGYDSAGLATLTNNIINEKKCSGRVEELEKILFKSPSNGNIGIGHVRWATHGIPNIVNAHPHSSDEVSVVHNGIIENSDEIKKELDSKGIKFKSQTDTEVVTILITEALKENEPLVSVFKTPSNGNIGIGHVRWATHGIPSVANAHPHSSEQVSVVHNGIIENSDEIKKELEDKGIKFKSQTDTEVVTLLITEALKENKPLESVFKTLKKLKGSFALGIIFKNFSNIIIGARRGSPLAVGYSKEENYIGSDSYALKSMTNKISYLDDGEICLLTKDEVNFYDKSLKKINKKILTMSEEKDSTDKGEYKHFMLKEINEQPNTVKNCIDEYVDSLKKKYKYF